MIEETTQLSRRYLANPHHGISLIDTLKKKNAVDLRSNMIITYLGNGYVEINPIDVNKIYK